MHKRDKDTVGGRTLTIVVKGLERHRVKLVVGARALLETDRTKGALHLAEVKVAVRIHVESLEELGEVARLVARLRGGPHRRVELPPAVEHLDNLGAHGRRHVRLKLLERDLVVAIRVKRGEHRVVHLHLLAGALLEADGAESALELAL